MKPIYILALHNVRTGGPEATHQLSDALLEQGFDARLVYFNWDEVEALARHPKSEDSYRFSPKANEIEDYACYRAKLETDVPNALGAVIVLPETLAHLTPKFDKATVLIWWLSVDNGFGALARVNLNHLRAPNVWHATQSEYARRFIQSLGLRSAGALTDYTTAADVEPLPWSERPKRACFNAAPHKVIANLNAIAAAVDQRDASIACSLIGGSRVDVSKAFATSRLYVDLGSFPGMDRMPREAMALGCAVLLSRSGAANTDFGPLRKVDFDDVEGIADSIVSRVNATTGPGQVLPTPEQERRQFFAEARSVADRVTGKTRIRAA